MDEELRTALRLNAEFLLGFLALGLWVYVYGKDWINRKKAKRYGTCAGCGRTPETCSCTNVGVTFNDDEE